MTAVIRPRRAVRLDVAETPRVVTVIRSPLGLRGRPGQGLAGTVPTAESLLALDVPAGQAWLVEADGHVWVRRNGDAPPWFDTGPSAQLGLSDVLARLEMLERNQLPAGSAGQVLVHDGESWKASDVLPT